MTSDVLDRTIDLETEEVSFAPRTLLKRRPWSASSFQRAAGPGGLTEIQPLVTTDPDAPCVGVTLTTCQQRDLTARAHPGSELSHPAWGECLADHAGRPGGSDALGAEYDQNSHHRLLGPAAASASA
jgi:hypothetical protein